MVLAVYGCDSQTTEVHVRFHSRLRMSVFYKPLAFGCLWVDGSGRMFAGDHTTVLAALTRVAME